MGAKVDRSENIVIGNQLDDIIEYQGYEEFHIEKINNALTQQKPKIRVNPSLNNHSGGSSIGKYESEHDMNKENDKNQEDKKEKNNEEENNKLKQAQKPPAETNNLVETKNENNEENKNNPIENNNNEQKLENIEKKDEDIKNDNNVENKPAQIKEYPIEEPKNNENNFEKNQNNAMEEKDKDKDKAKEEENVKTNYLNEQEANKEIEKEKEKEKKKEKEEQNEVKNENVNPNNDKNNDLGNNENKIDNENNEVTEQNKADINKDKNEVQENANINTNYPNPNENNNNNNNNEEAKKIENENENKNDEFAPKKIILPTIDTIISQKVLEEGAGNELLFMSNLNKIVHISIKERVKYAEKFCITTKDNFLIYETRENYIKVKKPLAIIPINYIKNVVLFKLTKKIINYDHFYIEFQLNESMRNNVYNQIDTFYINDLDNTNNENKNDTALVMFKTEEKNLAKKWYVLLKYLAELKSNN